MPISPFAGTSQRTEKWYAVTKGRKTGVYGSWGEVEEAKRGSLRPRWKLFGTKVEALKYYADRQELQAYQSCPEKEAGKTKVIIRKCTLAPHGRITDEYSCPQNSSRLYRMLQDSDRDRLLWVKIKTNIAESMITEAVANGIKVGEHEYECVGPTESSLRVKTRLVEEKAEQSCEVLFLRTVSTSDQDGSPSSAEDLRRMLGDLKGVYLREGPGKWAARFGLNLTDTHPTIEIKFDKYQDMNDFVAEDGTLLSDGCGIITLEAAVEIAQILGLPYVPSAFQIRKGGVKGMLGVYPAQILEKQLGRRYNRKYKIYIRPSMEKYHSEHKTLEIVDWSRPATSASLNVCFILVFLACGLPFEVIQRTLEEQMGEIGKITTDRSYAIRWLENMGMSIRPRTSGVYQELYEMLIAGHALCEPFLSSQLRSIQHSSYEVLRKKLRIRVPKSTYLFGIVDETEALEDGQVYVNVRGEALRGPVLVTRNPCYLPSAIKKLEAVAPPELAHLENVIVFPSKGKTSLANSMGGGDFDGDKFITFYDSIYVASTSPPAHSSETTCSRKPEGLKKRWTPDGFSDDITNLIINCHKNPVGLISFQWMRQCQSTPLGANHPTAIKLAEMFQQAIDYFKHGGELPDKNCLPLDVEDKSGQYQYLKKLRALVPAVSESQGENAYDNVIDDDLAYKKDSELWRYYAEEAKSVMVDFNWDLAEAIEDDKLDEDDSAFQKYNRNKKNLADIVKISYVRKFFSGKTHEDIDNERIRASAWYHHGYAMNRPAFAWLGARYLNQLKAQAVSANGPGISVAHPAPQIECIF